VACGDLRVKEMEECDTSNLKNAETSVLGELKVKTEEHRLPAKGV
jgi:hypothetical protein